MSASGKINNLPLEPLPANDVSPRTFEGLFGAVERAAHAGKAKAIAGGWGFSLAGTTGLRLCPVGACPRGVWLTTSRRRPACDGPKATVRLGREFGAPHAKREVGDLHMRATRLALGVASMIGLAACGGELVEAAATARQTAPLTVENGRELNGRELNGRELNGRELNGRELNGRELNGRELNGVSLGAARLGDATLSSFQLAGTLLLGTLGDGSTVSGAALVGALLTPAGGDGSIALRIDAYAPSADPEINLYWVSYGSGDRFWPLCGRSAGSPVPATALAGRWSYDEGVPGGGSYTGDPDAFTFACQGAVLYKCTELGYKPWKSAGGQALAPYHQACTRALRADYCGDGTSFTRDGTLINIYDGASVQLDTESWAIEAEWSEAGARCVDHRRVWSRRPAPACLQALAWASCGEPSAFQSGALIVTEAP